MLKTLFLEPSVGQSLLLIALVIAAGVYLGKRLTIKGMTLGMTWILFCGLVVSAFGIRIMPEVEQLIRDFGLVLFVYSLGLQAGPSFFSSFSHGGVKLNLLAVAVILLGVGVTLGLWFVTGEDLDAMVGVMTGAVTNTPSMGAAQQTFADIKGYVSPSIASGYALAYPFSVLGVIATIAMLKRLLKVDIEKDKLASNANKDEQKELICVDILLNGMPDETIASLHKRINIDIIISRIIHADGVEEVAESNSRLQGGDTIRVLTDRSHLGLLELLGKVSVYSSIPKGDDSQLVSRRIVVTKSQWNGRQIGNLALRDHYHVSITRVIRAGVNLLATPSLTLQLGDRLIIVGDKDDVSRVADMFGNELKRLDTPHLIPVFLCIALGIVIGSVPIVFPGMSHSFRLGLAGGTLVAALLMGRFGPAYKVVTYVTTSANYMLRDMGLALFLAAVGLGAGQNFVSAFLGGGYMWILYGITITVLPLLIVGWVAYKWLHVDYLTVAGMFTGAYCDAPALAYAMSLSGDSNNPSVAYATVYPLAMFLRIIAAQTIILLLC